MKFLITACVQYCNACKQQQRKRADGLLKELGTVIQDFTRLDLFAAWSALEGSDGIDADAKSEWYAMYSTLVAYSSPILCYLQDQVHPCTSQCCVSY